MHFSWKITTIILCNYGFWKEVRPATPFLTPFLVSEDKNFTDVQLYSSVYPFWTYSYLIMLIPVFVLTDLLRYKPVIVTEGLAYIGTWLLLIFGTSIGAMQCMQIVYGFATATEVAYYAYIYAAIDEKHYQKATSFVRSATLGGRCVAYTLGQILISTGVGDYFLLNYISLGSVSLILILALILPNPDSVKRESKTAEEQEEGSPILDKQKKELNNYEETCREHTKSYFLDLVQKFRRCYSVAFVMKWSIWWSLATCGFFQIGNYIQNLWAEMQKHGEANVYNGVTEAISTLLGTGVAFSVQFIHINWSLLGELVLGGITAVGMGLLILISQTQYLVVAYALYIIYCSLYQFLITIATFNVASRLEAASFGLVFGWNTFMALILQTMLTFSVADEHGFNLGIRSQFIVYGCYHGAIAVVFLAMGIVTIRRTGWSQTCALVQVKQNNNLEIPPESSDLPVQSDKTDLQGAEVFTTRV